MRSVISLEEDVADGCDILDCVGGRSSLKSSWHQYDAVVEVSARFDHT